MTPSSLSLEESDKRDKERRKRIRAFKGDVARTSEE
jgi:hypothetical protein